MRRRTLDALLTTGGAIVAVVLLVAAGLLFWAGSFANNTVSSQLAGGCPRVMVQLERHQSPRFVAEAVQVYKYDATRGGLV